MRIIDADELLKGRTDHEMISTHLIFNAPTVDVLGKARAEIEHVIDYTYDSTDYDKALYNGAYKDGLYEALDIINKYR